MKLKSLVARERRIALDHMASITVGQDCPSRWLDALRRCGCAKCVGNLIPRLERGMAERGTAYHAKCVGFEQLFAKPATLDVN